MKLTEAQARIAEHMASGAVYWRSRWDNGYYYSAGNGTIVKANTAVIDRMRLRKLIAQTEEKTERGNYKLALTDAGRTALSATQAKVTENG